MIEQSFGPLGWYEKLNNIKLNPVLEAAVEVLGDPDIENSSWETSLGVFRAGCQALKNPVAEAYYLAKAARAAASRNEWAKSEELVDLALKSFREQKEQQSLIEWVGGALNWQNRKGALACRRWKMARESLQAVGYEAKRALKVDRSDQISVCLDDLQRWVVQIMGTVEGGYLIFSQKPKSELSKGSFEMVQLMKRVVRSEQRYKTWEIIELLEGSLLPLNEYPEVMAECGLAAYQMGNVKASARYL